MSHEEYKVCFKDECMKIMVTDDLMTGYILFYAPIEGRKPFTKEDIMNNLRTAGIAYGIDEKAVDEYVSSPIYDEDLLIARGLEVVQGQNAYIEYKFNTNIRIRPEHNPNGTVNFRKLNNISHVEKGDLLAELHPAVFGKDGINVYGKPVPPAKVSQAVLKYGKNISASQDNLRIYSLVNGHATLENDRVFVSDVYEVPYDVDNSTGDIDYSGSVVINGNVRTGFKVRATGDVEVIGIVEDAEIISGGQVVLHHGIHGRIRSQIVAKGNIVSKFIENARVFAGGYIEAEAIIQSQVSANGDIIVSGTKGYIRGGHTRSAGIIDAKVVGSDLGISTLIEVGLNPALQDEIARLKVAIEEKEAEDKKYRQLYEVLKTRLEKNVINEQQKNILKNAIIRIGELKKELPKLREDLSEKMEKIDNNKDSLIIVRDKIYVGSKLVILGETKNIMSPDGFCKYINEDGVIKSLPL